ncbi:hypothetical protein [Lysinibacillus sp. Ag94]|uniref:hypothetical protein n=1 Tax=Lysinibacillus sp. Ag94 TaxID=2936682 RepID=UPI00200D14D7|nr:hypothetical protein [Lysinibacillus sp. Ag94]UPW81766.1 hypothetical protein MY533_13495 [Lysinibacillus sp. Ag94]
MVLEERGIVRKSLEERFNEQNKNKQLKVSYTLIGFIGAIVSISMDFYKLFIYENNDSDSYYISSSKNVYVGGDAYSYILNGTYATFMLVGSIYGICLFNVNLKEY